MILFMVLNMMIGLMIRFIMMMSKKKRETLSKFLQKLVFKNFFCENFDYVFNFEYDDRGWW